MAYGDRRGFALAGGQRVRVLDTLLSWRAWPTMSAGVAELQEGGNPLAWISRADEALYAAKGAGRNRVRADPVTSETRPPAA